MQFDIVSSKEIPALLASHVSGPYRFVQHAWVPYVRIGPSSDTEPITIQSSERLRLLKSRSTRLTGLKHTVDFTVIYDDQLELHLVQTPFRATQLDPYDEHAWPIKEVASQLSCSIHLGAPVWENSVEGGGSTPQVEKPQKKKPERVVHIPSFQILEGPPAPQESVSPTHDVAICDALRDLAVRAQLELDLKDYLVIPTSDALRFAPLPDWAVTSKYVNEIHVVKPRLGTDTLITL